MFPLMETKHLNKAFGALLIQTTIPTKGQNLDLIDILVFC